MHFSKMKKRRKNARSQHLVIYILNKENVKKRNKRVKEKIELKNSFPLKMLNNKFKYVIHFCIIICYFPSSRTEADSAVYALEQQTRF